MAQWFYRFQIVCVVFFLISCVSTSKTIYKSNKVDKKKEVESRVQVALSFLQEGEPEQAIFHLKQAVDANPKSARVHEVLGLSLDRVNDVKLAQEHFEKMLKYDPEYTRGRSNYASFLYGRGMYEKAYEQFSVVIKDIYYPKRSLAYFMLATTAKKLDKHEEVGPNYQKAVSLNPNFAVAVLELARFKFDNKKYTEASKYLDAYRKKVKTSSASALLLGIKLARVFEDSGAEASYLLALKNLYPRSKEYLYYIQNIRDKKGG